MLGKLWEQLEHHIITGLCVPYISYISTVEKLIYRIGQGSCSSPILWALLNKLILTALEETYDCITLVSVDNSTTSKRPDDYFVDDTTTGGTAYDDVMKEPIPFEKKELMSDDEAMVKRMEDMIQFFLTYYR
jgi:hypothetical protein